MSYSDENSFEKILDRCLSNERLEGLDKRVGSVIYDALAPVCMELAEAYVKMDILESQSYFMTATGSNLDKRVYDYGIKRRSATYALRIGSFKKYKTDTEGAFVLDGDGEKILVDMELSGGERFATPNGSETFEYIGKQDGYSILRCEQVGSSGNAHEGIILPLLPVAGLVEARLTGTYTPAEDEETDEALRARTKEHLNYMSYGGNIADYIDRVNALDGVGQTKVFPAWQYNGSVLLSVVSPTFDPISSEFAQNLKEQIDPDYIDGAETSGKGFGFAPIGHIVTVTTPVKKSVNVSMTVETAADVESGEVAEAIVEVLKALFLAERQKFAQNVKLSIYQSSVIQAVRNDVSGIINVTDVLLNGIDGDIIYTDEGQLNMQYLPYLRSVTINGGTLIVDDTLEAENG